MSDYEKSDKAMIAKGYQKVKEALEEHRSDFFIAMIIFLTALASFGLGRLSAIWPRPTPITIEDYASQNPASSAQTAPASPSAPFKNNHPESIANGIAKPIAGQEKYIASKSGTRYHFSWCPSALNIKRENKIWFATAAEARAKGYIPAANCPGLD